MRVVLALAAALAFTTGVTACSDSDDSGVASADGGDSTAGSAESDREQALLDFSRCMREEGGIPDYPDPEPDADGELQLPQPDGEVNQEQLQNGFEQCSSHLEGVLNFSEEDETALRDAQLEFAQCLRDEGIDVADPDPNQLGPGGFGELDIDDPEVQAAFEVCGPIFQEALQGIQGEGS